MLGTILRSLRTGVVTTRYPDEPSRPAEGFRGAPAFRAGAPFAAVPAPSICPSGALAAGGAEASVDLARCVCCGRCEEPTAAEGEGGALALGADFELAARSREGLVVRATRDAEGRVAAPAAAPPPAAARAEVRKALGRSLHLRHLDAGSCNGCDWELTALLNPYYDVRRLGIDFVASPRHADGVIVTGPVTRNLALAVERTYAATPAPRIVVAVGACASSGGIVGKGYASAGGVGEVLPVDVFIPGCPPRPEAIIHGILVALGRRAVVGR